MTIEEFKKLAMAFPEVDEEPHFERSSYRVKKKIFATLDSVHRQAVLKLNTEQQLAFCDLDGKVVYPVKGKWGEKGWTEIMLETVHPELLAEALIVAYKNVAPPGLADQV